ncbi:hypothetical protein NMG60_11006215 [Bertholletia excelsa]
MEIRRDEPDLNLREWAVKARLVSRESTNSRRFSASSIRSFREDTRSFRSNITISSTASSPGYLLREEIDPSTYSFTTALKALQARSAYGYGWECSSPEGFALNSKWNEAEKYICNPLSGEVPMECLSAKTLSGRSFRSFAGRMTMSAPLIYPSGHSRLNQTTSSIPTLDKEAHGHLPVKEKKARGKMRDVGTQSTPPELSSSSPSPASTPPIKERSIKRMEAEVEDSPPSNVPKEFEEKVEVKEAEKVAETEKKEQEEDDKEEKGEQRRRCRCGRQLGGCLSWRSLWATRHRDKHKVRKKSIIVRHVNRC